MFHVQLRQFPNVARAFNLSRDELDARILGPWTAGESIQWGDRLWSPGRAKLTIYEGPELRPEEIGMGRGWPNATRSGDDVTVRLLAQAEQPDHRAQALAALRDEILARAREARLEVPRVVEIASERNPGWRASERLALAEQAIWELLHAGAVRLLRPGASAPAAIEREQWQPVLFEWDTWTGESGSWLILTAASGDVAS